MVSVPRYLLAALCAAVLSLSGCTTGDLKALLSTPRTELDPPTSSEAILVIGYIDMSDTSSSLEWVDIERLKPKPEIYKNRFWRNIDKDTYIIYSEVLTTGQYKLLGFGGWSGANRAGFDLKDDDRFTRTFSKADIYNIGSYKINKIMPSGMIGRVRYEIVPAKGPSEREMLLKILPSAKHEYWKKMIERRLKELPK